LIAPLASIVRDAVDALQPVATLAQAGAVAGQYAPNALGANRAQTYLVMLANPSEMRPAGGFSGAIGTLVMDKGVPAKIDIKSQDAYNPLIKSVPVPYPMARYLRFYKNSLELGDSGWDTDFPTSAALSEQIFVSATHQPLDGTISIDPYAIAALLEVTGPVDVAGYGTFTSQTFFPELNFIVNVSTAPNAGKQALGPIADVVLNKVLSQPAAAWPRLFQVFEEQAASRHVQALFHDRNLAAAAKTAHFDGALVDPGKDYLMVADANVGATKGDYYTRKSLEVKAEVPSSGLVKHELTARYELPQPANDADRALNPGDGSYRDYVRFYLPEAAALASAEVTQDGRAGEGGLDSISFDHGREVVAVFFRLPRGHSVVVSLVYEVPVPVDHRYELYLQKQAGIPQLPTRVLLSYPGGESQQVVSMTHDTDVTVQW
jgi:hypothetical protein